RPQSVRPIAPDSVIDEMAALVRQARRPLLWLGGGAREAGEAAAELVRRGFGAVSSTNRRAVVFEASAPKLGALNMTPEAGELYKSCDLMIVVGSRLRGNETRNNKMQLPRPLLQIDADAGQGGRNYPVDVFAHGDAGDTLRRLLQRLPETLDTDPNLAS